MSEPAITREDMTQALLSVQSRRRNRLIARFGKEDLVYLAVVPAWTRQLAESCHFPVSHKPLEQFLNETMAAGICQKSESNDLERSIWYSAYVYTNLAPCLPVQFLNEAFTFIQGIEDIQLRAQSLAKLLPCFSLSSFQNALETMLSILDQMNAPRDRLTIQLMLIPHLKEEELRQRVIQEALIAIRQTPYTNEQVATLKSLVPYTPSSYLRAALEIAQTINEPGARAEALIMLIPYLNGDQRSGVLQFIEQTIDSVGEETTRTQLLSLLAEVYTRVGDLVAALHIVDILDGKVAVTTLTHMLALSTALSAEGTLIDDVVQSAIRMAESTIDNIENLNVVSDLALTLKQSAKEEMALECALRLDKVVLIERANIQKQQLVNVLCALAQIWVGVEEDKVIRTMELASVNAHEIDGIQERCQALTSVVATYNTLLKEYENINRLHGDLPTRIIREQQANIMQEALAVARSFGDAKERIQALVSLAPLLESPDGVLQILGETLHLAQDMGRMLSFWMPDTIRTELIEDISRQAGIDLLQQTTQEVGRQIIVEQSQEGILLSPLVARWATLAEAGPKKAVEILDRQIKRLLDAGETIQATGWLNAASLLCQIYKGQLEMSVLLGKRRIELSYRQLQDKRYLQHLLVRQAQVDAFYELVKDAISRPDAPWALHIIGMGGVGKTTLIRYITATLAPQMDIPTCRIDFDYLNPDYPVRKPGQILIELAQELQFYGATSRHEHLFREFQQRVVRYHEELSSEPFVSDPLDNIKRPTFDKVVRTFCDFISRLSQPVLFILDTCEELAKLQPVAGKLPNVEATFDILERIHNRVPSVRVIFAGRRLLARSGDSWLLDPVHMRAGQALLPDRKAYLRMYEIRGFTREEAHTFLTSIKKLTVSPEMENAILKRCPDIGRTAPLQWTYPDHQSDDTRHNPFDLALYADWVQESPALTPEVISSGKTDPFVELRIIGRIKRDDLRAILPAIILLRRFDRAMLRTVFEDNVANFDDFFWELGNLEWLEYQTEEKYTFLEISRHLYPRLLEYYRSPEHMAELEMARKRLVPGLIALVDRLALSDLRLNHIEAALRILPEEQGAQLWDRLSRRITDEEAWDWARTFIENLLGEEGVVASREHKAHALVLSSSIAVKIHEQPDVDLTALWNEVRKTAVSDTMPQTSRWLQQRVLAGRVAATLVTKRAPTPSLLNTFWSLVDGFTETLTTSLDADPFHIEQLAASLCAAIEALLEYAEATDQALLLPDPVRVVNWSRSIRNHFLPPLLQAFSTMLAGRTMALHQRWEEAITLLQRACALLPDKYHAVDQSWWKQRWADWRLLSSVPDYIRLQYLYLIPRPLLAFDEEMLLLWQAEACDRSRFIDAERLVSAILTLRLTHGVIPPAELEDLAKRDFPIFNQIQDRNAHRATPPLFATRALALQAVGRTNDALRILDTLLQESIATADDRGGIVRIVLRTRLYIVRRMRMAGSSEISLIDQLLKSGDAEDLALALPACALVQNGGETPDIDQLGLEYDESLSTRHAWWRSQVAWTEDIVTPSVLMLLTVERGRDETDAQSEFLRLSLALDRYETTLFSSTQTSFKDDFNPETWLQRYPFQMEQGTSLILRSYALGILTKEDPKEFVEQWAAHLGKRRMAELALDEGELLALRLPQHALCLLDLACTWFTEVDDAVGACITSACYLLATIHSGETATLDAALQRVQTAYNTLVERLVLILPPWATLVEDSFSISLSQSGRYAGWSYWLARIVFCILYVDTIKADEQERFASLLAGRLASADTRFLPIELTPPSASIGQRREVSTTESAPQQRSRRASESNLLETLKVILGLIIGLPFSALLLIGGYSLFDSLLQWVSGLTPACANCSSIAIHHLATDWKILMYILFLLFLLVILRGVFSLVRNLAYAIRARVVSNAFIRLQILPAANYSMPVSLEASVDVRLRLEFQKLSSMDWLLHFCREVLDLLNISSTFIPNLDEKIEVTTKTPGLQPYHTTAKEVPSEVQQLLTRLQRYLNKRQLAVPLEVAPGLEGISWEALFSLLTGIQHEGAWNEPFRFWRVGRPLPSDKTSAVSASSFSLYLGVVAHHTWEPLVTKGWNLLQEHTGIRKIAQRAFIVSPTPILLKQEGSSAILHFIGNPIMTASGLRLRISAPYNYVPSTSIEETVRGEEANILVRGEDLALATAMLVIVQAEPMELERRLDTDREQAYDLRSFAADVFAAGARIVIALPAVSPDLAQAILNELAIALIDQPVPDRSHILFAVSRIRRLVATWTVASNQTGEGIQMVDMETLRELALDICVFARWVQPHYLVDSSKKITEK